MFLSYEKQMRSVRAGWLREGWRRIWNGLSQRQFQAVIISKTPDCASHMGCVGFWFIFWQISYERVTKQYILHRHKYLLTPEFASQAFTHKSKGAPIACWMFFQITFHALVVKAPFHALIGQSTFFFFPPNSVLWTPSWLYLCVLVPEEPKWNCFLTIFKLLSWEIWYLWYTVFVSHNSTHTFASHQLIYTSCGVPSTIIKGMIKFTFLCMERKCSTWPLF